MILFLAVFYGLSCAIVYAAQGRFIFKPTREITETPLDMGWDYEDVSMEGSLSGGFDDESDDDTTTVHTSTSTGSRSTSSTSADTAKADCQTGHHNRCDGYNDRRSTIRATRYTASERVKILSGYGFGMSEIIRLEFTKREQRDNMLSAQRQQQRQRRNFSKDESYANFIPSSSTTTKLTQSTRRLSQTLRKRLHLKKISSKRRAADMNAWTTE